MIILLLGYALISFYKMTDALRFNLMINKVLVRLIIKFHINRIMLLFKLRS